MKPNTVNHSGSGLDLRVPVAERTAWIETSVITLFSIVLPAWAHPQNPFYVNEGFPWPALGPVLCALRYGFAHGFTSALFVVAALGAAINRGWWAAEAFPFTYAVGVIISAMLCGEFRDIWQRRLEKLQAANDYRGERLEEFTRSHHLLRVSHDQLEQQLAGSGTSVREMLQHLQQRFSSPQAFGADNARSALALLSDVGSVYIAAIYKVENDSVNWDQRLAEIGQWQNIEPSDAMVRRCLRERCTVAVTADANGLDLAEQSRLMVCVPFIDASHHCHAVLLVQSLPLFALTEARLRLLSIAAAHIADMITRDAKLEQQPVLSQVLLRMQRDQQLFGVESRILLLHANIGSEAEVMLRAWKTKKRALDVWQEIIVQDQLRVVLLLPLSDDKDARDLVARMDKHPDLHSEIVGVDATSAARAQQWLQ